MVFKLLKGKKQGQLSQKTQHEPFFKIGMETTLTILSRQTRRTYIDTYKELASLAIG